MKTTLLALDTSTSTGSVALLDAPAGATAEILFQREFAAGRSHSSQLFAVLEEALAIVPAQELGQIIVGLGPGSYAGVRIALSAATGLAMAGSAELRGISSIVGLAPAGSYAVLGDARQESHYLAQVDEGQLIGEPRLIANAELPEALAALPDELPLYSSDLSPERLAAFHAEIRTPSAIRLAELALQGKGLFRQESLEPIYLRAPHITRAKPIPNPLADRLPPDQRPDRA